MFANAARILAIGIGVLCSMATSYLPDPEPGPSVINKLDDGSTVRVTRVTPGLAVDCEVVALDPFRALGAEHFTLEVAQIRSGEAAELFTESSCDVVLLDHPNAGTAILRWNDGAIGTVALVEQNGAPTWTVVAGDLVVDEGQFVDPEPAPGCRTTQLPVALAESRDLLPFGPHTWLGAEDGPGGCALVRLRPDDGGPDSVSEVCGVPASIFPFAASAAVQVNSLGDGQGGVIVSVSDFDNDLLVAFHYDSPQGYSVDLDLDCFDEEVRCGTRYIPETIEPDEGWELLDPTFAIAELSREYMGRAETRYVLHAAKRVVFDRTCGREELNWSRDTIDVTVRVPIAAQ